MLQMCWPLRAVNPPHGKGPVHGHKPYSAEDPIDRPMWPNDDFEPQNGFNIKFNICKMQTNADRNVANPPSSKSLNMKNK